MHAHTVHVAIMADHNEEREILLPEDDNHQAVPSENHELEVSKDVERSIPSESSQGTCIYICIYMLSCYDLGF